VVEDRNFMRHLRLHSNAPSVGCKAKMGQVHTAGSVMSSSLAQVAACSAASSAVAATVVALAGPHTQLGFSHHTTGGVQRLAALL
jgi:hypothetical protein